MAHSHHAHREHVKSRQRVHHILKSHKRGGSAHSDVAADKKLFKELIAQHEKKEMKVEGKLRHTQRLDRRKRADGGKVPKGNVKPIQITEPSDSTGKEWMKGLSEKEIAATLGTTTRNPSSGMREHKKGGAAKYARGGKTKHKGTHINIAVVAPHSKSPDSGGAPSPTAMPPGLPPGGGGPLMRRPPIMPPPGMGGAPGMPPGMPPMMRGGKVGMTAGAESGVGRLQKVKNYGRKAKSK